ncbi:MAG: YbaN family protein [Thiohalomonadales bacterium]
MRPIYFILGCLFFLMGLIGAFLPVIPTTPFMLLALWCFSRSSPQFHHWLYYHKFLGPPLQQWHKFRVIPLAVKIVAILSMSLSLIYLYFWSNLSILILLIATASIIFAAWFILSTPSHPPEV